MGTIKKALGNAPVFVIVYIIFMLPTYFLPYVGSNSLILHGIDAAAKTQLLNVPFWLHLGSMLILGFLTWARGAYVSKGWLIIFPILAMVFDFVPGLSSIPLIPTVMHLLTIILGVVGAQAVVTAPPENSGDLAGAGGSGLSRNAF